MDFNDFLVNFANQFKDTDASEIQADTEYQELEEWSSLTALSLMALAKTKYGKTINGRDVRRCKTVEELYNFIATKCWFDNGDLRGIIPIDDIWHLLKQYRITCLKR